MSFFGFGRKKETAATPPETTKQSRYKILGTGCVNCHALTKNVTEVLAELEIEDGVQKVSQLSEIASYGVMSVPAFVIDDKVVSVGKVLSHEEIKKLILGA
ncbi:MAG TPA: thioredoxin family protein [Tissierellia bacterium]|nr:thioredoxin family protein [Tissierellia bacterium]